MNTSRVAIPLSNQDIDNGVSMQCEAQLLFYLVDESPVNEILKTKIMKNNWYPFIFHDQISARVLNIARLSPRSFPKRYVQSKYEEFDFSNWPRGIALLPSI